MFGIGGQELLIILLIVLLLFGAEKVPKLAKGLGEAVREFRKAAKEVTEADPESRDREDPEESKKKMTFTAHLKELRQVVIRCLFAIFFCAIPCGIFWRRLFKWIAVWPLRFSDPPPQLIFTAPSDAILFIFEITLTCGVLAALPFLIYQVWHFVAPGLYRRERRRAIPVMAAAFFCFWTGAAFCYFFLPLFLRFLVGSAKGLIDPLFRVNEYFSFLFQMCLVFGLSFELPVAAFVLSKCGLVDHRFLKRNFRYAVVAITIAGAILTPTTDALSLVIFCLPLAALYGISILTAFFAAKNSKNHPSVRENVSK